MADQEAKPSLLRQITARTSSTGTMLMGQLKSTTSMLNPMGGSGTEGKKENSPEKIPNNTNREYHSDEEIEKDEDLSNVSLSSRDELDEEEDQKHKGKKFLDHFKMTGSNANNSEDSPKEGILGHIKATTLSAGSAVITTTESAGAVLVGGLKATTQLLNPMNLVKPKEEPVDQKKVDEEFANIHIDEDAPEPVPEEKPKVGFFEQLKQKTGLAPAAPVEEQPQKYDPHSHTFPTPVVSHKPRFTHHDSQHDVPHDAHHGEKPKDPPKETFLGQIKSRTGFAKDDDIAHDSAPKEGFLSSINPFAGSASAEPSPARKPVPPPSKRASTTASSSSGSGGGITGMFDSLTGKSESARKPEPAKQASFMDHLTGKSTQPKKEPSFFDSLTGNSSATTSNKSEGSFW